MRICVVSDVHVRKNKCPNRLLFLNFLRDDRVLSCRTIILLGDIFELLVGNYSFYLEEYRDIFQEFKKITDQGIKIIYIQGNHDFHTKVLFKRILRTFNIRQDFFEWVKLEKIVSLEGKKLYFSHSDHIVFRGNYSYILFRSFLNSHFSNFLLKFFISFKLLDWLADRIAERGKKKYTKKKFNFIETKNEYRKTMVRYARTRGFDAIIGGHSHIKDLYICEQDRKITYANGGHLPRSRSFLIIDKNQFKFEKL